MGMLFKSEQKNDGMTDILKALHTYVPVVDTVHHSTVDVDGSIEPVTIIEQKMYKILFGRDQLTVERAQNIQRVRDNSSHHMDGLVYRSVKIGIPRCVSTRYDLLQYR